MKKRINWFKIIILILTIIEVIILFTTDRNAIKTNLNTWRLYCICIMFIPINVMIIGAKRKVKK